MLAGFHNVVVNYCKYIVYFVTRRVSEGFTRIPRLRVGFRINQDSFGCYMELMAPKEPAAIADSRFVGRVVGWANRSKSVKVVVRGCLDFSRP